MWQTLVHGVDISRIGQEVIGFRAMHTAVYSREDGRGNSGWQSAVDKAFRRQIEELVRDEIEGQGSQARHGFWHTGDTNPQGIEARVSGPVLGTRHTDLRAERTFTTANSVILNASCPVLTVPILLDELAVLDRLRIGRAG